MLPFTVSSAFFSAAPIQKLSVIGAGQMGSGIAQVAAQVGIPVQLIDNSQQQLDKSLAGIDKLLSRGVSKGRMSEADKDTTMGLFTPSTDISTIKDSDFVIEAATELIDIKNTILKNVDEIVAPDVIIGTNTSSISITKLASQLSESRQPQVIGMHFFNPVPILKVVEIISGFKTNQATLDKTLELGRFMNKVPTHSQDVPGFIANRILMRSIGEAIEALDRGIATPEDIDTTMKLGTGSPMGPLETADLIGLDTVFNIMNVLHEGLGETYRPPALLTRYVDAGDLGRKSGKGFYSYLK